MAGMCISDFHSIYKKIKSAHVNKYREHLNTF
jgi:hypothetical protein